LLLTVVALYSSARLLEGKELNELADLRARIVYESLKHNKSLRSKNPRQFLLQHFNANDKILSLVKPFANLQGQPPQNGKYT